MRNIPFQLKYFIIWTGICTASAIPSFLVAIEEYNWLAMVHGILIFILLYTIVTSSERFQKLRNNKILRRAFKFGFALRITQSLFGVLSLIGMLANISVFNYIGIIVLPDILLGVLATHVGEIFFGNFETQYGDAKFTITLFTTLVQGVLLNIVIALTMLLAIIVQLVYYKIFPQVADTTYKTAKE